MWQHCCFFTFSRLFIYGIFLTKNYDHFLKMTFERSVLTVILPIFTLKCPKNRHQSGKLLLYFPFLNLTLINLLKFKKHQSEVWIYAKMSLQISFGTNHLVFLSIKCQIIKYNFPSPQGDVLRRLVVFNQLSKTKRFCLITRSIVINRATKIPCDSHINLNFGPRECEIQMKSLSAPTPSTARTLKLQRKITKPFHLHF